MQTLPMIIIVMSLEVTKPKKKIDHFLMIMIMSITSVFMVMFFGVPTKT